jgi:hypothetical protein
MKEHHSRETVYIHASKELIRDSNYERKYRRLYIVQLISSIYFPYGIRVFGNKLLFIYLFYFISQKVNGKVIVELKTFQVYCILYCYHNMPYSNGQYIFS